MGLEGSAICVGCPARTEMQLKHFGTSIANGDFTSQRSQIHDREVVADHQGGALKANDPAVTAEHSVR
jgi:hypothetical protein